MQKLFSLEKIWWLVIALTGIAVFFIAIIFASNQSIWFDEGYSILLAKSNWNDLFSLTAVDAHPPFYYAVLKIWGSLFGFSELALRSLSALLLSGAVMAGLAMLRRFFSAKVALLVLPFVLFAPFLMRYGYEVRMYSMAMLIGIVATYVLVLAHEKKDWWRWAVYAVLVALGMYTLYMTLVIWLAHAVWLLFVSIKEMKRQPLKSWKWLYAYALALLLFLPYISTFIHQTLYSALPGVGSSITLIKFADIVSILFTYTPEWNLDGWRTLLILAGIILVSVVGARVYRDILQPQKRYYLLLVALTLVPIAFYVLTSLPPRTPIFINRYLAHVAIFIYMLVGVTLALGITYRNKWKGYTRSLAPIAYVVTLFIFGVGIVQLYATGNFIFERLQHPQTSQIREATTCNNTTVIVADDPYTYIDSAFYFDGCNLRFYSENPLEYKGGYAMLHNSPLRVGSSLDLSSQTLYRLGWAGKESNIVIDDRYELVHFEQYDRQLLEEYRLIAE